MQLRDIKRLRAVIYARSSAGKAKSIEEQIEECASDILDHDDWELGLTLTDKIPASEFSNKERPGYKQLVKELRRGDVLVVWEASRSNRKMPDFMLLRELCTERGVLWCVGGKVYDMADPDDRHSLTARINDAELETARLSKRVRRGKRGLRKKGIPDGRIPWGYRKITGADGAPTLEFDPETSPLVRDAVDRVLSGESWSSVCRDFNARGISRPASSAPWKANVLKGQLTREAHSGLYQGQRGNWPALISADEQERLKLLYCAQQAPRPRGKTWEPRFLLTGIATCSVCKEPMYGRQAAGIYRCEDGHSQRTQAGLDAFVTGKALKALQDWRFDTLLLDVPVEVDESGEPVGYAVPEQDQDGFAALRGQARVVRDRITELKKLMMTGRLNPDEWVEMRDELEKQAAELDTKAAAELADPLLTALAANPAAVWREWDMESKRAFLRQVVKKLEVIPQGRGRKALYPDSVVLEIKLPDRAQVAQSVIRATTPSS